MKIILVIAFLLIMLVIIITATLIKNKARFFEPPGFTDRLSVYLGQHTAATSDNHSFPELRTPVLSVQAEELFNIVVDAANDLGWQIMETNDESLRATLVITSSLFDFKDDLVVQVKSMDSNTEQSSLYITSSSRKGKADFAANAGHIQRLVQRVRQKLKPI